MATKNLYVKSVTVSDAGLTFSLTNVPQTSNTSDNMINSTMYMQPVYNDTIVDPSAQDLATFFYKNIVTVSITTANT